MAERAGPSLLVRLAWGRGRQVLAVALFVLVRVQTGSWWWAVLAGLAVAFVLPALVAAVTGWRAGRRPDAPKVFIAVPEIPDSERSREGVAEILAAREMLIRSGSARIEVVRHSEIERDQLGRGPVSRGLHRVLDRMAHQVGEGVIDFANQRVMLDFGHYAETQVGADDFAGLSGGPLRSTAETGLGTGRHPKPLWLIDVLTSATRTEETGVESVDEVRCRRFDVRLDLTDAALLGPAKSASLEWPDPTAVPIVVWLEGSLLRRIRYQETAPVTETLTFRDLGVNLSGLDWERMGTFRTTNPRVASPNAI